MADTGMSAIKQPPNGGAQHADLAHLIVPVARRGPRMQSHFPGCRASSRDRISCQDTRVSSLWTPSGEHRPDPGSEPDPDPRAGGGMPPEAEAVELSPEQYEELMRARAELAA